MISNEEEDQMLFEFWDNPHPPKEVQIRMSKMIEESIKRNPYVPKKKTAIPEEE